MCYSINFDIFTFKSMPCLLIINWEKDALQMSFAFPQALVCMKSESTTSAHGPANLLKLVSFILVRVYKFALQIFRQLNSWFEDTQLKLNCIKQRHLIAHSLRWMHIIPWPDQRELKDVSSMRQPMIQMSLNARTPHRPHRSVVMVSVGLQIYNLPASTSHS